MTEPVTKSLPAAAGVMRCQMSYELNAAGAKTAKVRAIVRTAEPVEVSGWATELNPDGRIVHDLSGYRLRKSPIPMLYNHGANIVGEWQRLELDENGNLRALGVLKSVSDGDLASELIKKLEGNLPFEASINFGDNLEAEEAGAGETVACNGRLYAGPLAVIRLFYLREISLCPLGADPLTSAAIDTTPDAASQGDAQAGTTPAAYAFSATVRPRTCALSMAEPQAQQPAPAPEGEPKIEQQPTPEATEAEPQGVEAPPAVEGQGKVEVEAKQETQLSAESLAPYASEFGSENTIQYFCVERLSEAEARKRFCQELKNRIAELASQGASSAVDFIPSDDPSKADEAKVKQLMKQGLSQNAAEWTARNFKQ